MFSHQAACYKTKLKIKKGVCLLLFAPCGSVLFVSIAGQREGFYSFERNEYQGEMRFQVTSRNWLISRSKGYFGLIELNRKPSCVKTTQLCIAYRVGMGWWG